MKLLLFKIQLAFHLLIFFIRLAANISNKTKPLSLVIFIFGLLFVVGGISLFNSEQESVLATTVATEVPVHQQLFLQKKLTIDELKNEITSLEKIKALQPKSRDILLNLAYLYSAVGDSQKSSEYKELAKQLDPNNPITQ